MVDLKSKLNAVVEHNPTEAIALIRAAVEAPAFDPLLARQLARFLDGISPQVFCDAGYLKRNIAVLAGYTFQPLLPFLAPS